MKPFNVPAGAQMLLGAPAQPMPKAVSDAIARMIADIDGVMEGHLPQCFVVGVMEKPAQILVVVIANGFDAQSVFGQIGDGLRGILPEGEYLDVWPVQPGSSMLKDVRGTACKIYESAKGARHSDNRKPWWKF